MPSLSQAIQELHTGVRPFLVLLHKHGCVGVRYGSRSGCLVHDRKLNGIGLREMTRGLDGAIWLTISPQWILAKPLGIMTVSFFWSKQNGTRSLSYSATAVRSGARRSIQIDLARRFEIR